MHLTAARLGIGHFGCFPANRRGLHASQRILRQSVVHSVFQAPASGVRADIHDLVSDREHLLTVFKKLNSWRCKVHKEKAKKADEDREVLRRMTEVVRGCPDSEKKLAELQSKYGAGLRNQWPGSIEDFKSTFIDDDYYEWDSDMALLSRELIRCGDLVQGAYDGLVSNNIYSDSFGEAVLSEKDFIGSEGLLCFGEDAKHYTVLGFIYADAGAYKIIRRKPTRANRRNFVGYIAHEKRTSKNQGNVDVTIAWRGTITKDEWLQDAKAEVMTSWNGGAVHKKPPSDRLTIDPFTEIALFPLNIAPLVLWVAVKGALALLKIPWHYNVPLLGEALSWGAAAELSLLWGLLLILVGCSRVLTSDRFLEDRYGRANWRILWEDVHKWPTLVLEWLFFWTTLIIHRKTTSSERVAFGFKEMYCDADMEDSSLEYLGPPRRQIYDLLTSLIEGEGLKLRSITTTGHSLGGALAALCAFDLGELLLEAQGSAEDFKFGETGRDIKRKVEARAQEAKKTVKDKIPKLKSLTQLEEAQSDADGKARQRLICALRNSLGDGLSSFPITAITFGAPRVGNAAFASRFGQSFLAKPEWYQRKSPLDLAAQWLAYLVAPVVSTEEAGSFGEWTIFSVWAALFWWCFCAAATLSGKALCASLLFWHCTPSLYGFLVSPKASKIWPHLKMIRVVNANDAITNLPIFLGALLSDCWYVHGGLEMKQNVCVLKDVKKNASFGVCHNLAVYLHLIDPSRDRALMNKSDDALNEECGIPPSWFTAVINKGLVIDTETKRYTSQLPLPLKTCRPCGTLYPHKLHGHKADLERSSW